MVGKKISTKLLLKNWWHYRFGNNDSESGEEPETVIFNADSGIKNCLFQLWCWYQELIISTLMLVQGTDYFNADAGTRNWLLFSSVTSNARTPEKVKC